MTEQTTIHVFLVNGVPRSGKDYLIDTLVGSHEYNVFKTSIIDPVKILAEKVGWDGKKAGKDRKFLAELMTLLDDYNNFPFSCTVEAVDYWITDTLFSSQLYNDTVPESASKNQSKPLVVCIVARQPKHLKAFQTLYQDLGIDVTTILVRNKKAESAPFTNDADAGVMDFEYDIEIHNDYSKNFKHMVLDTVSDILENKEDTNRECTCSCCHCKFNVGHQSSMVKLKAKHMGQSRRTTVFGVGKFPIDLGVFGCSRKKFV